MVITLTLNPAIDRTIKVDEINDKDVTRVQKTLRDAAGKGINVSKVVASLGGSTICTGFLAGENGKYINDTLTKLGISTDFVWVDGETRENIKIQETTKNNVIEINEKGPNIEQEDLESIKQKLDTLLKRGDILVISGSVPTGVPINFYHDIIMKYNDLGVITILDTSLELLKQNLSANPKIIKPNLYELSKLVQKELETEKDIIKEARQLCDQGINEVIVSLGKDGSLYVNKEQVYKVTVPIIKVESTVGAGDSFVAGLSFAIEQGYEITKKLKFASSVASASCMAEGTNPGNDEDIDLIFKQTILKEV